MLRTSSRNARLAPLFAFGLAAVAACASTPEPAPEPQAILFPSLERACVEADGRTGRKVKHAIYTIDTPGGRRVAPLDERECFFPWVDQAGWARIQSVPGAGDVARSVAFGQRGEHGIGGASFELAPSRTISRATIGGPVELSWTWDDAGRALARIDFAWADAQVTLGGRLGGTTRVHLARAARGRRNHVWESTVFASADARGRLHEAHVTDGPLSLTAPRPLGISGIHPICPLTDRELWEDFDGRAPRVQRCVRGGRDWLRIERDAQGRIVTIWEDPAAAGGPEATRTIRIEWHAQGAIPASLRVERDGIADGLEARFDLRGIPTLTRHHRLGRVEGLEVEWDDIRASTARVWTDGKPGPDKAIVPRGTGSAAGAQPRLTIELPTLPDADADAGAAWLDQP